MSSNDMFAEAASARAVRGGRLTLERQTRWEAPWPCIGEGRGGVRIAYSSWGLLLQVCPLCVSRRELRTRRPFHHSSSESRSPK